MEESRGREIMIDRRLAVVPVLFLVLAACDATTTTTTEAPTTSTLPPTTTLDSEALAVAEYDADVELINQLWWDQSIAWFDGFDSGIRFWVDNNYPDMGCTFDDYMVSRYPDGPVEELQIERIANPPTIRLDEGWTIPGGKLEGEEARGRVYTMAVRTIRSAPSLPEEPPETVNLHVTILDGRAHFFFGCPPPRSAG